MFTEHGQDTKAEVLLAVDDLTDCDSNPLLETPVLTASTNMILYPVLVNNKAVPVVESEYCF